MYIKDTIAAIATAPGRGGIGIVRISGDKAVSIAEAIVSKAIPKPRQVLFTPFIDGEGEILDQGIALIFSAPHSFTGEDILELQGHGGPVVLHLILKRCLALGARLAEPGEFARRAFLNNKLDLAQAEAIADLIDASTTEAALSALRALRGDFSNVIHALVDQLTTLRVLVEAVLDFPDEEIDFLNTTDVNEKLCDIDDGLQQVINIARQGSLFREGVHVVLFGQPNVGKSSLLNQLAKDDVAIVTNIAGTTRDIIRQTIQIEGVPVHIIDTAGLRDAQDEIERIGVARAWNAIENANIGLLLIDVTQGISVFDQEILKKLPKKIKLIRVFNKIDVIGSIPRIDKTSESIDIYLSAKTGEGIVLLCQSLLDIVGWSPLGESVFIARERHLLALAEAHNCLQQAKSAWPRWEFIAEELRLAQNSLSQITGEFTADDLLGEIFSNFCIGK